MALPTSTSVYGKIVANRDASVVKSKIDGLTGFKYPIQEDPLRGYFSKAVGNSLVKSMLSNLLRTSRGERFMLPDYGCNLKKYLMEPLDETTFGLIRKEVLTSINKYLRQIRVNKLQIFENKTSNFFNKVLNVKLSCSIKDEVNNNLDVNIRV